MAESYMVLSGKTVMYPESGVWVGNFPKVVHDLSCDFVVTQSKEIIDLILKTRDVQHIVVATKTGDSVVTGQKALRLLDVGNVDFRKVVPKSC